MKMSEKNTELKGEHEKEIINNIQKTPEERVADQISQLPSKTLIKLLLAEDQAQKGGDHRSILDPNKYYSLLTQVDPSFMVTLQKQIQELRSNVPSLIKVTSEISDNPEKLADMILTICGISERSDFLGGDLQAKYPKMNKSSLVKLGAKTLYTMMMGYIHTLTNLGDNRTAIEKFDKIMSEIVLLGPKENSNLQPPK